MSVLTKQIELSKLYKWWLSELASIAQDCMKRLKRGGLSDGFVLVVEGQETCLLKIENGAEELISSHFSEIDPSRPTSKHTQSIAARLNLRDYIRQEVVLPYAVRDQIDSAITYQLDGLTPFQPADVLLRTRLQSMNETAGTLTAEMIVVPRKLLDDLQARAAQLGYTIDRLILQADNLAPFAENPTILSLNQNSGAKLFNRPLLFALIAILFGANVAVPFWKSRSTLAELRAQRTKLEKTFADARSLGKAESRLESRRHAVEALQERNMSLSETLEGLTGALDDTSYLTELKIEGETVTISGFSSSASKILQAVEADPKFTNARFLTPINRESGTDLERFSLSVVRRGL